MTTTTTTSGVAASAAPEAPPPAPARPLPPLFRARRAGHVNGLTLGVVVLHESLAPAQWIGLAAVLAGVLIAGLAEAVRRPTADPLSSVG